MARTKREATAWVLLVCVIAAGSALLVSDTTGAHLELAPLFVGVALAVTVVQLARHRQRRGNGV